MPLAHRYAYSGPSNPLQDVSDRSGVTFVLRNAASPERHQIETMPGGVAVLDYDNDGYPDLFFTNGARQSDLVKSGPEYWNRLFHNRGDGTFEDVTERAGLRGQGFDMGVAAADFDNDGFTDLFVAGVRRNTLYRNRGDGTFEDVTRKSGLAPTGEWSVAAGWFDYDNDGLLDLFVVNYVKWDPEREPFCGNAARTFRTYCHPRFYEGLPNRLYHNEGNGKFRDVSAASGIAAHTGKGMGVAFADYDGDGDLDVFVANDTVPNFLFRNDRGVFREVGEQAGIAYNDDGRALSSMGADFRDYDNDGREDVFTTALINEMFPLYRNLGRGVFSDMTRQSGIGRATLPLSGWSAGIYDLNNDGWKDLFAATGDVQDNTELFSERSSRQRSLILINQANGKFSADWAGPAALYRGAAWADFDGDGKVDIVLTRLNDRAVLLKNTFPDRHWLDIQLVGTKSNHDGIGAKVRITTPSGRNQWNHATTSVGYASSSDRTVHFGLGEERIVSSLEVLWPSGMRQRLKDVPADQRLVVTEPSSAESQPSRSADRR